MARQADRFPALAVLVLASGVDEAPTSTFQSASDVALFTSHLVFEFIPEDSLEAVALVLGLEGWTRVLFSHKKHCSPLEGSQVAREAVQQEPLYSSI